MIILGKQNPKMKMMGFKKKKITKEVPIGMKETQRERKEPQRKRKEPLIQVREKKRSMLFCKTAKFTKKKSRF